MSLTPDAWGYWDRKESRWFANMRGHSAFPTAGGATNAFRSQARSPSWRRPAVVPDEAELYGFLPRWELKPIWYDCRGR